MDMTARKRRMAGNTVYTTLLVVALIALIIGVGYLWYRDSQISGSWNPFKLPTSSSVSMIDVTTPLI